MISCDHVRDSSSHAVTRVTYRVNVTAKPLGTSETITDLFPYLRSVVLFDTLTKDNFHLTTRNEGDLNKSSLPNCVAEEDTFIPGDPERIPDVMST